MPEGPIHQLPIMQPCAQHTDVLLGMREVTVVLTQVRDTIADVCLKFEAHTGLEGHPLMAQRMRNLEESHARHTAILEQLAQSTRTTSETVNAVLKAQEETREDRRVGLNMKTQLLVALIALSGTLGASIMALVKR